MPSEIQEYKPSHPWQLLLLFVMQIRDQRYAFYSCHIYTVYYSYAIQKFSNFKIIISIS